MKSKLIVIALALGMGALGFWYGSRRTARYWQDVVYNLTVKQCALEEIRSRARASLRLLAQLHEGQESEVAGALERQLSVSTARLGAAWKEVPPDKAYGNDLWLIRDIRNYRSQHPWTNDPPELVQRVQSAFKLADALAN